MCIFANNEERISLHEYEVYCKYQADEGGKVIPMQGLTTEQYGGEDTENNQRNTLLDYLELHQGKWSSVFLKADTIGWYLKAILKESNTP